MLAKHVEHQDLVEKQMSETEDKQVSTTEIQKRLEKALSTLQAKAEYFEALSQLNNLRIVGLRESTNVRKIESSVERLLIELLGLRHCLTCSWWSGCTFHMPVANARGPDPFHYC
ncbi:hypothetical protein NDU88_003130 [Pleurodeles waltl]|uniref:Uncharacterized protein n=1 Tax=Pleurodeles waltl TaxID=8319 RepID=A0AAV7M625_PLEWA|nr:hypothetical protein NDU88_003130 [Pleurodeles waltl]